MMMVMMAIVAFFIGAIPTGYLLVKWKNGTDIRQMGSGNLGATNVFRVAGKSLGIWTLILDIAKGYLAVLLGMALVATEASDPQLKGVLLGVFAILGHVFTPFLGFKGGKGVATSAGVGLAVYPMPLLLALFIWFVVLWTSRYMSVASLMGVTVFVCLIVAGDYSRAHILISFLIWGFIVWTHRQNWKRLWRGEELKLHFGRKS